MRSRPERLIEIHAASLLGKGRCTWNKDQGGSEPLSPRSIPGLPAPACCFDDPRIALGFAEQSSQYHAGANSLNVPWPTHPSRLGNATRQSAFAPGRGLVDVHCFIRHHPSWRSRNPDCHPVAAEASPDLEAPDRRLQRRGQHQTTCALSPRPPQCPHGKMQNMRLARASTLLFCCPQGILAKARPKAPPPAKHVRRSLSSAVPLQVYNLQTHPPNTWASHLISSLSSTLAPVPAHQPLGLCSTTPKQSR